MSDLKQGTVEVDHEYEKGEVEDVNAYMPRATEIPPDVAQLRDRLHRVEREADRLKRENDRLYDRLHSLVEPLARLEPDPDVAKFIPLLAGVICDDVHHLATLLVANGARVVHNVSAGNGGNQ